MSRCSPHRPNTLKDSRPLAAGCISVLPRARRIWRQKMESLGGVLGVGLSTWESPPVVWDGAQRARSQERHMLCAGGAAEDGDGRTKRTSSVFWCVACGACGTALSLRCCGAPRCVRPLRVSSPCCAPPYTATWCREIFRELGAAVLSLNASDATTRFGASNETILECRTKCTRTCLTCT